LAVFRPKEFQFSDNRDEVLRTLRDSGKHAHIIAGGTGFYELARRGYIPEVKQIVSIMKLGLSYIRPEPSQVTIGATTILQEIMESRIGEYDGLEAIGDALREIRPLQVRNVATIGGEICISVPIVDLPTALLACDASIKIIGQDNQEYSLALDEFYVDAFLTKLKYGEIVREVIIPKKKKKSEKSAFVKLGRTAYDFNLINVGVSLKVAPENQKLESLKVILGGIKRTPVRVPNFEKKLLGKRVEERTIVEAAESTIAREKLFPSVHGSSEYKAAVLPIVLRDCIMKAYQRSTSNN